MSLFRHRAMMDTEEILAMAGLQPLKDEVFLHLAEQAISGQLPLYFAAVPTRLIRPFDPSYDPSTHPVGRAAIDQVSQEWRAGSLQRAVVYPKGDEFVLSDDYIVWAAVKQGQPDYVPCWVLGKPLHADVCDVQGPVQPSTVFGNATSPNRPSAQSERRVLRPPAPPASTPPPTLSTNPFPTWVPASAGGVLTGLSNSSFETIALGAIATGFLTAAVHAGLAAHRHPAAVASEVFIGLKGHAAHTARVFFPAFLIAFLVSVVVADSLAK